MAETGPNAFVAGWPVEHSRSPLVHRYWLRKLGLAGSYELQVVEPQAFPDFLTNLEQRGFIGGNITVPHKEAARALVTHADPAAMRLSAVNTVWLEDSELHGSNTDGYGFLANLDERAPGWEKQNENGRAALVLGAGGAARAVVDALLQRSFEQVHIVNRTLSRAEELANMFGHKTSVHDWSDLDTLLPRISLFVNTTIIGLAGQTGTDVPLPDFSLLPDDALVTDIVYIPLQTPMLQAARARGFRTVDGVGMLLHQAVPGFERWFGQRPEVTPALRRLVLNDIGEREPVFLGLTGSIGMGKSTTAEMFHDAGIPVHDSDAVVHRLYAGEAVPLVEAGFSGTTTDKGVDREKLGTRVVGDPEALQKLEKIVHPLVRREETVFREKVLASGAPLAVLDVPLLFETGGERRADAVLVVTAPPNIQRQRIMERGTMSEPQFEAMVAKQTPDTEKRSKADFVIDTSKGMESARAEVAKIIEILSAPNWMPD